MDNYKVIDNLLTEEQSNLIENTLIGENFPWFISGTIPTTPSIDNNNFWKTETAETEKLFSHFFYDNLSVNSNYFNCIEPIIQLINPVSLMRIKANLQWKTDTNLRQGFHKDTLYDNLVGIYYVNTNNGKTLFEDGTEINSVKNRLLIFKGSSVHSGTTCTDKNFRCVINFLFYPSFNGIKL